MITNSLKLKKKRVTVFSMICTILILATSFSTFAINKYPIYNIEYLNDNSANVNINWKYSFISDGIKIETYRIENGKNLKIGYSINSNSDKSVTLPVKLDSAIPPIRVLLYEIGKEDKPSFPDVYNEETKMYIKHLRDMGIVNGRPDGMFGPDANVTRAEFMVMILKALGKDIDSNIKNTNYSDVEGHWAKGFMLNGVKEGIIKGYEDGTLRPDSNIRLAEVSTIIANSYDFKTNNEGVYSKLNSGKWYSDFVKKMFDSGVLNINDSLYNSFDEDLSLEREFCAMMISRAIATY